MSQSLTDFLTVLLILASLALLLGLLRLVAVTLRAVAQDVIRVYSEAQSARLNSAIGLAQLQAAKDSARQALLERRALLQSGRVMSPQSAGLRLDKAQLQPPAVLADPAALWQEYSQLKMEVRRQQLLEMIDREDTHANR